MIAASSKIPPQGPDDVHLQLYIPAELKERLRGLQYRRKTTYRELVIQALEETFPSSDHGKGKRRDGR